MDNNIKELLYRSFDEKLTPQDIDELKRVLAESQELREEKEAIETLRKKIAASGSKSFSTSFADRVMERISPA